MSNSAFDLKIANIALTKCGVPNITSLSDNSTEAEVVASHIAQARNFILQTFEWSELFRRAKTTPDPTATPDFGYTYAHQLPSDFVRVRSVQDVNDDTLANWEIEGRYILTDEDELRLRYVSDELSSSKLPAYFYEVIGGYLATQIAFKLRPEERTRLFDEYLRAKAEARRAEHSNHPTTHWTVSRSKKAGTY
jgi:hypothetical protein